MLYICCKKLKILRYNHEPSSETTFPIKEVEPPCRAASNKPHLPPEEQPEAGPPNPTTFCQLLETLAGCALGWGGGGADGEWGIVGLFPKKEDIDSTGREDQWHNCIPPYCL